MQRRSMKERWWRSGNDGMIMIPYFLQYSKGISNVKQHFKKTKSLCHNFILCNDHTLNSTMATHNTRSLMINTKLCIPIIKTPSNYPMYGYCDSYLAILKCEPPTVFLALVGTPTFLPLFRLIPSSLAFSCSWIFLFCAQLSANFCMRIAAITAIAADLSLGRRSCTVTSGVMPI